MTTVILKHVFSVNVYRLQSGWHLTRRLFFVILFVIIILELDPILPSWNRTNALIKQGIDYEFAKKICCSLFLLSRYCVYYKFIYIEGSLMCILYNLMLLVRTKSYYFFVVKILYFVALNMSCMYIDTRHVMSNESRVIYIKKNIWDISIISTHGHLAPN